MGNINSIAQPAEEEDQICTDTQCRRTQKAAREFVSERDPESSVKWDVLISVALAAAMRRAERLNCTWGDVDFDAQTVDVPPRQSTAEIWQWVKTSFHDFRRTAGAGGAYKLRRNHRFCLAGADDLLQRQ